MSSTPSGRAAHKLRHRQAKFIYTRNLDFYLATFFN
jgi:hypothetical protein